METDFQTILNQLLTIKTDCEKLGMNNDQIAKLKLIEHTGIFKNPTLANINFKLADDNQGNKYLLLKKETKAKR